MPDAATNGTSRTVSWIMGIIASILLAMGGFILQGLNSRVVTLEAVIAARGESIARLEATAQASHERYGDIAERLRVIEEKIDLLGRSHWRESR